MNNTTNNAYGKYFEEQAKRRGFECRAALPEDIIITPNNEKVSTLPKFVEVAKSNSGSLYNKAIKSKSNEGREK